MDEKMDGLFMGSQVVKQSERRREKVQNFETMKEQVPGEIALKKNTDTE